MQKGSYGHGEGSSEINIAKVQAILGGTRGYMEICQVSLFPANRKLVVAREHYRKLALAREQCHKPQVSQLDERL